MKSVFRNWSDIPIFLSVMRLGSTLAAARALGMAQPTVARRIEALEQSLGLTLFDRDTRGSHPTAAAKALLPAAEAIEAQAQAFARLAADQNLAQPIRITGFSANLQDSTSEIFSGFSQRHPDIAFEFLPAVRVLDLAAGEADIALRICWTPPDDALICRHISDAKFTLFGSPDYAAKHGLPKRPEELKDHIVFGFHRDDIRPVTHDWLASYMPEGRLSRRFSEITVLDAAVRAGQGLGIINLRLAEKDERAGRLIRCFEPPEALCAPHLVLIAPQAYRRPEVRSFLRYFIPRYAALFK
ncbi:LysR family transcriptional regulator [Pseudoruegeria sp. SHC-113]|uniref:LysR family transcriptional regulator n=1 Tax=Pseudoruegeria sp. SHC-113 TaxID=2855439 RepID=UPI0021BA3EB0|nr:LysR family transcriptional regulator [Pseudoruegeria sp. SHC-113]MCT8158643.1 LysR family transcriptional regulator [Pseudoruegeria sp. SHC-113]